MSPLIFRIVHSEVTNSVKWVRWLSGQSLETCNTQGFRYRDIVHGNSFVAADYNNLACLLRICPTYVNIGNNVICPGEMRNSGHEILAWISQRDECWVIKFAVQVLASNCIYGDWSFLREVAEYCKVMWGQVPHHTDVVPNNSHILPPCVQAIQLRRNS